ncbi:MAG TPA: sulfotransferase domain-containing protein [Gammaproteobacteria bacterium]|nr:sulfotransferase domain-containing protein [Gammaproteobacteria bacterium]
MKIDKKWGKADPTHDPYALANFRPRPTDVLITTAAKAGTTWMQQILHQLRSGGDEAFTSIDDVVPWLELPRDGRHWSEVLADYERIPDPRIFKTHCTYEQTPGTGVARIILTSRDPRDCCVSFYHHRLNMTDESKAQMGMIDPESFDAYLDDWLGFGSWYRNVSSWWPHRNDENVLWLRYEDLQRDLAAGIDRILAFLHWHITDAQRENILRLCSFRWMKENDKRFSAQRSSGDPVFKPGTFIRKGQVGEGKATLSPSQEKRILDKARECLSDECLEFFDIEH